MTDTLLRAGTIGLTTIPGDVGLGIRAGQFLVAEISRHHKIPAGQAWADYQHAFIYLGDGDIIEAEPGGARISSLSEYDEVRWLAAVADRYPASQLASVADAARTLEGRPYSFLDYGAIAAHALHVPVPGLKEYITETGHLICSQLCDFAYEKAGLHLFADGRWPGYVDPLDLYLLDVKLSAAQAA